MEMLLRSAVYLAVIGLGYLLKRAGVFRAADAGLLSRLVLNITLPAAVLKGFAGVSFSGALLVMLGFSAAVNCALLAGGLFFSRGKTPSERALSVLNTGTFNNGNFAIPFLSGSIGTNAFAGMCMFDMGCTAFTFGANIAAAQAVLGSGKKVSPFSVLKNMFRAPTFVAYCLALCLAVLGLSLPGPVADLVAMAAGANSFLAMFCIGILFEFRFPKEGYRTIAEILGARYAICAAAAVLAWFFLPVPGEMARTVTIQLFAPVANCAVMQTVDSGGDGALAAAVNSMAMIVSVFSMLALLAFLPAR